MDADNFFNKISVLAFRVLRHIQQSRNEAESSPNYVNAADIMCKHCSVCLRLCYIFNMISKFTEENDKLKSLCLIVSGRKLYESAPGRQRSIILCVAGVSLVALASCIKSFHKCIEHKVASLFCILPPYSLGDDVS